MEKPPVENLLQLEDLIKLEGSERIAVGMNFRFSKIINIVDEITQSGDFGKLVTVHIEHVGNKPREGIWNMSLLESLLLAQSIHAIDLAVYFSGFPQETNFKTIHTDNGLVMLEIDGLSKDKVIFHITTGNYTPHFVHRIVLVYDSGKYLEIKNLREISILDDSMENKYIHKGKKWSTTWSPSPLINGFEMSGYYMCLDNFFDSVHRISVPKASLLSLLPTYQIIDKILSEKN